MHKYPAFMCLDITEFLSSWTGNVSGFYLQLGNANNNGNITSFQVEYYKNSYVAGQPTCVSPPASDVPKATPGYVTTQFRDFHAVNVTLFKHGIGVRAIMKNTGSTPLFNIPWSIICNGKFLFVGGQTDGTIPSLAAGASQTISQSIFGFGRITIEARCNNIASVSKTARGLALLSFTFAVR